MTLFDTQRRSIRISRFLRSCRLNLTTKCDFHSFNGTGIICLTIRAKTSALNVNPMRSTAHTWTPFWKIFLDFRFRMSTNFGKTFALHHHICHCVEKRLEPEKNERIFFFIKLSSSYIMLFLNVQLEFHSGPEIF